jgi:GH15 family glucan-1,4-alpha-glucosidase
MNFKNVLLLTFIFCEQLYPQLISFPDKWQFKTGDDLSYKEINYNDKSWDQIFVTAQWEEQGYQNYDGFAWYRIHFNADKTLLDKELYLLAGIIDDIDETYLDGILIGSTGKLPPDPVSKWNVQRIYKIPEGLLKEENTLAIRVYDGQLGGGIYSGYLGIYDKQGYIDELDLGPPPKKSFYQLVTSNGLIAAVYNEKKNVIENLLPHIFQSFNKEKRVQPFLRNLKVNTDERPSSISYLKNTHIVEAKYKDFVVNYFAPFIFQEKVFYAAIQGEEDKIKNLNFSFDKTYCEVLQREKLLSSGEQSVKYFLFSFNDSLHNNSKVIEIAEKNLTPDIIDKEVNLMESIFDKAYIPDDLSNEERNLYEQSITILKMAQVADAEIFPKSKGQILASMPPGSWNITWLRDGIYSILALNRIGFFNEAKSALKFFLNADAGLYKNFVYRDGIDYGVKNDYKISVCRYFGMGIEESDFNDNGPNIELDGFGLFLIAFTDYINKSGDSIFFKENYKILEEKIAKPLIYCIDKNNLIRKESGPWEEHLPGKQFAFTSITAAAGLSNLALLKLKYNPAKLDDEMNSAIDSLVSGLKSNLIRDGVIKGYNEAVTPQALGFFDGGTFEFFNFGLEINKMLFQSHLTGYEEYLKISKERGFSRLNNPDWYTIAEWPFINLRIASACLLYGERNKAKELISWTTAQSKFNNNLIAELYDFDTSNYGGAIPMVGFGAGAYILALCDYYEKY